jgi:mono/diheme cytochrome c family protein
MKLNLRFGSLGIILGCSLFFMSSGAGKEDSDASNPTGKAVYSAYCEPCHGKGGKGDGKNSAILLPRPRDLTEGKYEYRTTESGTLPTDDDLTRTINAGLPGTSMPGFAPFIQGDSLRAVVAYIKSFSPRFGREKPLPVRSGEPIPSSPSSIARGKAVYQLLECSACHGDDGMGSGAVVTEFENDWGHSLRVPNLNEPWTFRGGSRPMDVFMRIRTGLDGTPMPSYVGSTSDQDLKHLANYVLSIARKPIWRMQGSEIRDFYTSQAEAGGANPVSRGEYIVRGYGCADCHTPIREDGTVMAELRLAGGQRWKLGPYGEFYPGNLTSDEETGLGAWTDDQIKLYLRSGVRPDGTRMLPFPMPWPGYAHLTEDDINAIVAYLRTVPPIRNKVPDPQPKNIISYLWSKFKMLILKEEWAAYVYPGNAGVLHQSGKESQ